MRTMPFPFLSEETIQIVERSQRANAAEPNPILNKIQLDPALVAKHWLQIEEHKWFLSERLGRDIGTNVAAVDYFENIHPEFARKTLAESVKNLLHSLRNGLERLMEFDGPNSILNLERMARGNQLR